MEETHEPLRHTTALTIHADKYTPHCGWIELTENLPFMIDSSTIGVVIGKLRNHSKQTCAFLRSLRRESFTVEAHKRPVSPRRVAVYNRRYGYPGFCGWWQVWQLEEPGA